MCYYLGWDIKYLDMETIDNHVIKNPVLMKFTLKYKPIYMIEMELTFFYYLIS